MSTYYFFVCDKCKEISDTALAHNFSGGFVDKETVYEFLKEHFLERVCPSGGIRIVMEQTPEECDYRNPKDEGRR